MKKFLLVLGIVGIFLVAGIVILVVGANGNINGSYNDEYEQYTDYVAENSTTESIEADEDSILSQVESYISANLSDVGYIEETLTSGTYRQYTVTHLDGSETVVVYDDGEITHTEVIPIEGGLDLDYVD